jgi:hypothetical protein
MTPSNEEFLSIYTEIERQIKQVLHEPNERPHLGPNEIHLQPNVVGNDEPTVRPHTTRCESVR